MDSPLVLYLSREGSRLKVRLSRSGNEAVRRQAYADLSFEEAFRLSGEIAELLRSAYRGETAGALGKLRKAAKELYDMLMPREVKEELGRLEGGGLVLELDEELLPLPWELLYDGRRFLSRAFTVVRQINTGRRLSGRPRRPGAEGALSMLVVADPDGTLPEAAAEGGLVEEEVDGWPERVRLDMLSGRVGLRDLRRTLCDYDVLHYSGHGAAGGGWRLRDGVWGAAEVEEIAGEAPLPFLVFANACDSGLQGENALAGAFLHAGVSNFIGTMVEIPDARQSSLFALEVYRRLAQGAGSGEAVAAARSAVAEAFGEESLSWAAYLLYGTPGTLREPEGAAAPVGALPSRRSLPKGAPAAAVALLVAALTALALFISGGPRPDRDASVPPGVRLVALEGSGGGRSEALAPGSRLYRYGRLECTVESRVPLHFAFVTLDGLGRGSLQAFRAVLEDSSAPLRYRLTLDLDRSLDLESPDAFTRSLYLLASVEPFGEGEAVGEAERLQQRRVGPAGAPDTPGAPSGTLFTRIDIDPRTAGVSDLRPFPPPVD